MWYDKSQMISTLLLCLNFVAEWKKKYQFYSTENRIKFISGVIFGLCYWREKKIPFILTHIRTAYVCEWCFLSPTVDNIRLVSRLFRKKNEIINFSDRKVRIFITFERWDFLSHVCLKFFRPIFSIENILRISSKIQDDCRCVIHTFIVLFVILGQQKVCYLFRYESIWGEWRPSKKWCIFCSALIIKYNGRLWWILLRLFFAFFKDWFTSRKRKRILWVKNPSNKSTD